ncbi:MAG: agmatinase [Desulfobacterales bacterium]|nr:agmatinase [Desulfobacterales bacterium]
MTDKKLIFGEPEYQIDSIDNADVIVLPICYEYAPSYGKGSQDGPIHILTASEQLEFIDEETLFNIGSLKFFTLPLFYPNQPPPQAMDEIYNRACELLNLTQFMLALGGDHSITYGLVKAASQVYTNLSVLQIDAHLDLRDMWNGSPYNHSCVMRRIIEDVDLPITQVGIRSIAQEEFQFLRQNQMYPIFAHDLDNDQWIDTIINQLSNNVYLTVDLDGLDPSVIPGTGTPEPGGLTYRQLINLIKSVSQYKRIVASDINELCKIPHTQVSEYTAARIASKILVYRFSCHSAHP